MKDNNYSQARWKDHSSRKKEVCGGEIRKKHMKGKGKRKQTQVRSGRKARLRTKQNLKLISIILYFMAIYVKKRMKCQIHHDWLQLQRFWVHFHNSEQNLAKKHIICFLTFTYVSDIWYHSKAVNSEDKHPYTSKDSEYVQLPFLVIIDKAQYVCDLFERRKPLFS